jgi:hypothetical protein
MPSNKIIKLCITSNKVKQLESKSIEESKLNDVLILCLEAATTQLTSGYTLRVVRIETTLRFVFRTYLQYT